MKKIILIFALGLIFAGSINAQEVDIAQEKKDQLNEFITDSITRIKIEFIKLNVNEQKLFIDHIKNVAKFFKYLNLLKFKAEQFVDKIEQITGIKQTNNQIECNPAMHEIRSVFGGQIEALFLSGRKNVLKYLNSLIKELEQSQNIQSKL